MIPKFNALQCRTPYKFWTCSFVHIIFSEIDALKTISILSCELRLSALSRSWMLLKSVSLCFNVIHIKCKHLDLNQLLGEVSTKSGESSWLQAWPPYKEAWLTCCSRVMCIVGKLQTDNICTNSFILAWLMSVWVLVWLCYE